MEGSGGGLTMAYKAEIDTSAPFQSVKEAVMLFGERVLAGEVYASKLKEMQDGPSEYGDGELVSELKETKQSLQKAREESIHMARCLYSLQQELEQTKQELQQLKIRASDGHALNLDMEDLKFMEHSTEIMEQVKKETLNGDQKVEFQKKKCVTFANPPLVAQVMLPPPPIQTSDAMLQRHPSLKKKKKPLIPFIGGIFSKKRGSNEVVMA